jgi:hypothetical protein
MEIWKEISGSYGPYEVSSEGRFRRKGRVLKASTRPSGYVQIGMYESNTKRPAFYPLAHRLVAEVFLGPIPEGMQVNHKNGVRSDNRVENLEIVTAAENNLHAFRVLGRESQKGEQHPMAKLTGEIVSEIRWLFAMGARQFHIAKEYALDPTVIRDIVYRRRWKHL